MEEYSNLKGGLPATSVSERVWGVPKKRKTTDGNPKRGESRKRNSDGERRDPAAESEPEEYQETEELGYGSNGIRKKKNLQVDVII